MLGVARMKFFSYGLFLSLVLNTNISVAADAAAGKSLYAKCIACHGQNGEGNVSQQAPKIAGQYEWYIYSSLLQFKNLERKNPTMLPFIKNLSDKDYQDLAAYISSLK